jgi:hypothetical protein
MNRNKSIFIFALISLLISMAGCQLAKPDEGLDSAGRDRLVGVYVTREHLDLFDLEGYLNDNPALLTGGEIKIDGVSGKYNGRIYAVLQDRVLTDDAGNRYEDQEYVFEGVDGIALFFTESTDSTGNACTSATTGEEISDGSYRLGDETELEGTIYVTGGRAEFYFNPVYQSSDGSVYLIAGQGTSGDLTGASSFSHAISDSYTVTEHDGETRTGGTRVEITIQGLSLPEQITLLQMGEDGTLLKRDSYVPADMPDSIVPDTETGYLIVETRDADKKITRALCERGEDFLTTYVLGENGICLPRYVELDWGGTD